MSLERFNFDAPRCDSVVRDCVAVLRTRGELARGCCDSCAEYAHGYEVGIGRAGQPEAGRSLNWFEGYDTGRERAELFARLGIAP